MSRQFFGLGVLFVAVAIMASLTVMPENLRPAVATIAVAIAFCGGYLADKKGVK